MPVVLASLNELIIAAGVVLVLWAARQLFGGLISGFANRLPFLGSALASILEGTLSDAINTAERDAGTWLPGILGFMLGPIYWIEGLISDGLGIFDALRQQIAYVAQVMLVQAVQVAEVEAEALVARAVASLDGLINSTFRIVQVEFGQVYTTIDNVQRAILAYIAATDAAIEAELGAAISAETSFVTASIAAVQSEIGAAISAETAFVEAEVGAAVAYTQAVAAALGTEIAAGDTAITTWVTGQITSLVGAIDLVQAATLTIALTAAKAVEADLQNLKDDCTDNLCSGASGIASLVNGLLDAGFVAALLGYAGWAATDPRGCGDATAEVLVPIATGAKDVVQAGISAI